MNEKEKQTEFMTEEDEKTLKWIAQVLADLEPLINQKAKTAEVSKPSGMLEAGLSRSEVKEVADSISSIFERLEKQEPVAWEEFVEVKIKAFTLIEKIEPENSILPKIER